MPKLSWEYLWFVVPPDWSKFKVDGRKTNVKEYMNMLGKDRWELVQVVEGQPGNMYSEKIFFFKRPQFGE